MDFPMISVIVPVFNTVQYLEKTAGLLAEQTYKNLEIILVDDGSTDGSSELCDRLVKKDARFQVIHQKNSGVCAARNVGISAAKGAYIGFCDADDEPYPDLYETLYHIIEESGCDIAAIRSVIRFKDDRVLKEEDGTFQIYTDQVEMMKLFLSNKIQESVYTKLFRTDICREISFPDPRRINEDKYYVFCALRKCSRLGIRNVIKYRYCRHEESASTQHFSEKYLDIIYFADQIEQEIRKELPELSEYARKNTITSYLRVCQLMVLLNGMKNYRDEYRKLRNFLKKEDRSFCRRYLQKKSYIKYRLLLLGKLPFRAAVKLFSKF